MCTWPPAMHTATLRAVGIIKPILQLGKLRLRKKPLSQLASPGWGHTADKTGPTSSSVYSFAYAAPIVSHGTPSAGHGEEVTASLGIWHEAQEDVPWVQGIAAQEPDPHP